MACAAYWGDATHYRLLSNTIARICDSITPENGLGVWLNLRWYPVFLLLYSAGVASISANNYDALAVILKTKIQSFMNNDKTTEAVLQLGNSAAELHDVFKAVPGHDRNYVPRSEYLFKLLQPKLDDLFFIGRDYEILFDYFEILFALVHIDLEYDPEGDVWGPLGRFGWKYKSRRLSGNIYKEIVREANSLKSEWAPLKAGLFSGSIDQFLEISKRFEEEVLQKLSWW